MIASAAKALAAFTALAMPEQRLSSAFFPALMFALMVAHQGVRVGHSVHVVDMADLDKRATYTALGNTVVGLILLVGVGFGVIAQLFGVGVVLAVFALMAAMATVAASHLDDVQSLGKRLNPSIGSE